MSSKIKMLHEGQKCRKCYTPVVRKYSKKYTMFQSYLYCPNCKTGYYLFSERLRDSRQINYGNQASSINQKQLSFC